jgi:DNA-directed RNA polymerase specialized sigma24 family protein
MALIANQRPETVAWSGDTAERRASHRPSRAAGLPADHHQSIADQSLPPPQGGGGGVAAVAVLLEDRENRGPAETATARDLLAHVLILLTEELPEKPRRAFLMARVDGLSYRAIAQKRCASAVGEGAMAVAFVHRYLASC